MKAYTSQIYQFIQRTSDSSAREIVPVVFEYLRPNSVIDFGCGNGDWLAAFKENGTTQVLGLDGDWVDKQLLAIASDKFLPCNLKDPFKSKEKFDLAVCLEVIGHLTKATEDILLDSITNTAPIVLFSAPIPHQKGIGHDATNCEWPSYWANKFAKRGFVSIDCLRNKIWSNPKVAWWFAQNIFMAIKDDFLSELPALHKEYITRGKELPSLVHPGLYLPKSLKKATDFSCVEIIQAFPKVTLRAIKRRLMKNLPND